MNYDKYFCRNQGDDRVRLHNMNLRSLWFDCLGSGVYVGVGFACASVVVTIILLLAVFIYRKQCIADKILLFYSLDKPEYAHFLYCNQSIICKLVYGL